MRIYNTEGVKAGISLVDIDIYVAISWNVRVSIQYLAVFIVKIISILVGTPINLGFYIWNSDSDYVTSRNLSDFSTYLELLFIFKSSAIVEYIPWSSMSNVFSTLPNDNSLKRLRVYFSFESISITVEIRYFAFEALARIRSLYYFAFFY